MATPTNVNIKQLNQIEEIVNGNFLIVETDKGTNIIDFKNFVVGPDNVSFYNDFAALCAQVTTLSSYIDNTITSMSATVDSTVTAQINSLSAAVDEKYRRVFYQSGILTFPSNNTTSDAVAITVPTGVNIVASDINLTFLSTVIPTVTGTVINVWPSLGGGSPVYTLQANLNNPAVNLITVGYNVFVNY